MILIKITNIYQNCKPTKSSTRNDIFAYIMEYFDHESWEQSSYGSCQKETLDSFVMYTINTNDEILYFKFKERFKDYCWHELIIKFVSI